jgi:cyclase
MLAKRIIACLDVRAGRVVKGVNFVGLRDAGDPVELAGRYNEEGADELVFLDITATHEQRDILKDVVRRTAEELFIPLTVGGGINDLNTIYELLRSGADKVSLNSAAVRDPSFIDRASREFGQQCIVVAIDARHGEVYVRGGREATGREVLAWAKECNERGAGEILLTSMDCDGTQQGYDISLTQQIAQAVTIPVVASGGAGKLEHIRQVLTEGCAQAALLASLLHYRQLTIAQIKADLTAHGVLVRG